MNPSAGIFFQSFVKPFYKENAGALVFVYTMMFCIVSTMDGAGMFAYHYSLVTSMLTSGVVFLLVFFLWFIYARKCAVFVASIIHNPQYSFLYIINCLSKRKRFLLFFIVEAWLLLPILSYSLFIVYVGCHQHFYLPVLMVVCYLLLLCMAMTAWHVYLLYYPQKSETISVQQRTQTFKRPSSYPAVVLWFVMDEQKVIWVSVKVFSCGVLYLIARYNTAAQYDIVMPFLFFNFGVYSNGVLVYLTRQWEERYLSFYRSLPVPSLKRMLQYGLIYFILLLPEFIMAFSLVPVHLHYKDAVSFSLCAYSLLLLMNSVLFLKDFSTKEYVIVLLFFFCVQYILLPTAGFTALYLLFFAAAIILFLTSYYRYERNEEKESG